MKFNSKYVAFTILERITKENNTELTTMALISEVNQYMRKEHHRELTQTEFEDLYDYIDRTDIIGDYEKLVNTFIDMMENGQCKQKT